MNHVDSFQVFEGKRDGLPVLNSDQKWFLKKVTGGRGGYTINPETKKIDVESLDMYLISGSSVREEMTHIYKSLTEIGFGVCKKDFILADLGIENLKGSPEVVGGNFRCHNCDLINLEGSPEVVKGDFIVNGCPLKSLKGSPEFTEGHFNCSNCSLTSLKEGPKVVKGNFVVSGNYLENLVGSPESVGGFYWFGYDNYQDFTLEGLTPLDKIGVESDGDRNSLSGGVKGGDGISIKKKDLELPTILNLYRLADHIPTQEMLYPLVTPEKVQEYIDENPERFVTGFLPKIWDHVIKMKGYENLKVPQKYQEEFDDFSDLSKLGF